MNQQEKILLITGGLVLLAVTTAKGSTSSSEDGYMSVSYLGNSNLPRGIRNNNPGNLRISNSPWQGKIPANVNTDGAFEQFSQYVWGVRAMTKLLINYMNNGHRTLRKIISRYAPASENNTTAYVNAVSQATGLAADSTLTPNQQTLRKLVITMSFHENGQSAVDEQMFNLAWSLI